MFPSINGIRLGDVHRHKLMSAGLLTLAFGCRYYVIVVVCCATTTTTDIWQKTRAHCASTRYSIFIHSRVWMTLPVT